MNKPRITVTLTLGSLILSYVAYLITLGFGGALA